MPKYRHMNPKCKECGAPYGYDLIKPHADGCSRNSGIGVLSDDVDWDTTEKALTSKES
jgi:hypothetical protein